MNPALNRLPAHRWCMSLVLLLALILLPKDAKACAACGCADPTLTVMGDGKPSQNRLRLSLEPRALQQSHATEDGYGSEVTEQRLLLSAAWAPHPDLFASVSVPLLRREVAFTNLAVQQAQGMGEPELRARYFVWKDKEFAPSHLLALAPGIKLPTSASQRDEEGRFLDHDAQLGTGALDAIAGLSYSLFQLPWSLYSSITLHQPLGSGRFQFKPARTLRTSLAGQWQPLLSLALRTSVDIRVDSAARDEVDTGGWIVFLSPQVVYALRDDLLLQGRISIPTYNALRGAQDESFIAAAGLIYDI